MNFFEAQERARKRTGRLVILFSLAVLGTIAALYFVVIIGTASQGLRISANGGGFERARGGLDNLDLWQPGALIAISLFTIAVVGLTSLFKWMSLRQGGATVAQMVGGRPVPQQTRDPAERRLLNIVEEMAIASGLTMPAVYVLDDENGINAFAAGMTPDDAVVAVTRGTLNKLNRDELQGVIAHEFSHILNGDMRLNVRITAIIFGLLAIGLMGRGLLRVMFQTSGGSRKKGGHPGFILVGLALMIIGYISYFFGRIIQAAVSRQREFLADASAVQFTRNPGGISGALKKIGGISLGSSLSSDKAAEIGHFFFAQGLGASLTGLWDTHPPLDQRIKAIDPNWDGRFFDAPDADENAARIFHGEPNLSGLAPASNEPPRLPPRNQPRRIIPFSPAAAIETVGTLTPENVARAQNLLDSVPFRLREAARISLEAPSLVFALLINADAGTRGLQIGLIASKFGGDTATAVQELLPLVDQAGTRAKLPLLTLALPTLRELPSANWPTITTTCDALIAADRRLSYFEFALRKVLSNHLHDGRAPAKPTTQTYAFQAVVNEVAVLLSSLAWAGSMGSEKHADGSVDADARAARAAFAAGLAQLPSLQPAPVLLMPDACAFQNIDAALDKLAAASLPIKRRLLLACMHAIQHDGEIRAEEAELLRAFADSLNCPMPPLEGFGE